MEGTSTAYTFTGEKGAEEVAFTQNSAAGSDRGGLAGSAAAKSREIAVAAIASILSRQLKEVPHVAAARANSFQASQAAAGEPVGGSPQQQQQEHEQRQHPSYKIQQTEWSKSVSSAIKNAVEPVRNEAYATPEAAEQAAAGRRGAEGFIDNGFGRDKEQQKQPTEGRESSSAATGVLAALCTLLAMFLVGALVWVQVREMLQLGRSSKQKARTTQEKAKRSRSTSRDNGGRARKACGWGQWRHGHEKAVQFQKGVRRGSNRTVSGDGCREDAARGRFCPASEERNSSLAPRAGTYALQQHVKAEVGVLHQQGEDERGDYSAEEFHQEENSADAGRELEKARSEDSRQELQQRRVHREIPRPDDDDDEPTKIPRSSDECESFGLQQSEANEGTKGHINRDRVARRRHGSGNHRSSKEQQRQPPYCGRSYGEGPNAHPTASDTSHPRKVCEYNRISDSTNVSHSLPAAWRDAAGVREEDSFPYSSSFSAEEEDPDSVSATQQGDHFCSMFAEDSTRTDSAWFSSQVRPLKPSAAVVSLQNEYEEKCRHLFTRLGEVVAEDPVKPQTFEALEEKAGEREEAAGAAEGRPVKNSSNTDTYRFDRPALLSEEAVTEAEQLLTLLEEMFADIKRDFRDNQPGNVTCMIRCCNGLLEKDGLMVLSRCTKVPRLMQKAQSVVETVVPCIWSS